MPTTPTRMANGILQNAQSAFNTANSTTGNNALRVGNKVIKRFPPASGFGIGASKASDRLMTSLLPGVNSPGGFTVADVNGSTRLTPVAQPAVGEGPTQDIYTQALTELQDIIKNPNAGRRDVTTALGNKYNIIDRPKLEALQNIINAVGERYKTDVSGAIGSEQVAASQEKNRLTGLGIQERSLGRLSSDIAGEESRKLEREKLFQNKLKTFSPATGASSVNARAGLFRMALSGEEIPSTYKKQANSLIEDFNKKYADYLKSNSLEDTEETKRDYIREYENGLL